MSKKDFIAGYMIAMGCSRVGNIGCPSWARHDRWYPSAGSDRAFICFYRDIHGGYQPLDCEGDVRLIDGEWVATVSSNNGWDNLEVGRFSDPQSAMDACDSHVGADGTDISDELYNVVSEEVYSLLR